VVEQRHRVPIGEGMKTASPALLALLASGRFVRADLWTITLNGGTVLRWTSHDLPISYGGFTWVTGPTSSARASAKSAASRLPSWT
jgi:hypothetical protein